MPNSSFECGAGRGWIATETYNSAFYGNNLFVTDNLTNQGWHGTTSFIILKESRMVSRGLWLTNGGWCLSYYLRTADGSTQTPLMAGVMAQEELSAGTEPSAQNGNASGTWTRFTTNFTVFSNAFYFVKFYSTQNPLWVDALQVEPGSTPTAYAPVCTVEAAIVPGGTYGMWFAGQTPTFSVKFWNEGGATSETLRYWVHNLWNSNVLSGVLPVALGAATNATSTFNLPQGTGWYRVTTRLIGCNDSSDSATQVVYPYASNTVANATNDWLGGHAHSSEFHASRERLAGRRWTRSLSPMYLYSRWQDVEPTRGNFVFQQHPRWLTNWTNNGISGILCLTPADTTWTSWATNADGSADLMAWSNYCYVATLTNAPYLRVVEVGPNEPKQTGPKGFGPPDAGTNLPINVQVATNYARVLSYGVAGVTNADPTIKILGIAGASGNGTWAWEVWTNLTENIQGWIYGVSTHIYFDQIAGQDPNQDYYAGFADSSSSGWITRFGGIKPVWNTEGGAYGVGYHQGLNQMYAKDYDLYRDWAAVGYPESIRAEKTGRQLYGTMRNLSMVLRCIGYGFEKFFYYDCRYFNAQSFTSSAKPYASDYMQIDRPEIVSLSVAQHMVRRGFGPITNSSAIYVEMYCFTNASGQAVVAGWCADKTNHTVTVTNGSFAVIDCMGNQVTSNSTTFTMTLLPQYFVSGTLSLVQLSNTLGVATMPVVVDVLPPQVSFDIAPNGLWSGDTNRQLFKWTAIDASVFAYPSNYQTVTTNATTNVLFKWKMDSGAYTDYSQSNHLWLTYIPVGNHTFYVTAKDKAGNAGEYYYDFVPIPRSTNVLHVIGTANIGTVTVVPP